MAIPPPAEELLRTPLYDLHLALGARMVPFAGTAMPVSYPAGVLEEHLHTRRKAGLFDVSHMGQLRITGPECAEAFEALVPMDIADLEVGRQRYALLTNDQGGIRDDLMVVRFEDGLFIVVNAACKEQDTDYIEDFLRRHHPECQVTRQFDRGLLALQGPEAVTVLSSLLPEVATMRFMDCRALVWNTIPLTVSRSGYTGEDGFEIGLPAYQTEAFARALLAHPDVAPIGLGARDSLRLEAGLCLYGHDLTPTTTPVEANLSWAIQKVRRPDGTRAGHYPGAEIIARQLAEGPKRKRVGLQPEGRAPIREGVPLFADEAASQVVGEVTSGGFGPSFGGPVAMGYVASGHNGEGTRLFAVLRGRIMPVMVRKLPFIPAGFKR